MTLNSYREKNLLLSALNSKMVVVFAAAVYNNRGGVYFNNVMLILDPDLDSVGCDRLDWC